MLLRSVGIDHAVVLNRQSRGSLIGIVPGVVAVVADVDARETSRFGSAVVVVFRSAPASSALDGPMDAVQAEWRRAPMPPLVLPPGGSESDAKIGAALTGGPHLAVAQAGSLRLYYGNVTSVLRLPPAPLVISGTSSRDVGNLLIQHLMAGAQGV
ncbi:MAG: hypothetical protein ACREMU_06215 [Gemmatimonadaceae bacterium]